MFQDRTHFGFISHPQDMIRVNAVQLGAAPTEEDAPEEGEAAVAPAKAAAASGKRGPAGAGRVPTCPTASWDVFILDEVRRLPERGRRVHATYAALQLPCTQTTTLRSRKRWRSAPPAPPTRTRRATR